MIDYIKLILDFTHEKFADNLQFHSMVNLNTGEIIKGVEEVQFENFKIVRSPRNITIEGSLQVLYNISTKGVHQNHDDFDYFSLKESIKILEEGLGISLDYTRIVNLEVGFNVEINQSPKMILENHLASNNWQLINASKDYNGNGCFKEFTTSQYWLKLYDKGMQFQLDKNILRIEIKYRRASIINRMGIHFVKDLRDHNKLRRLSDDLLKKFGNVIIIDDKTFDKDGINPLERKRLQRLFLPNLGIPDTEKNFSSKRSYQKKRIMKLLEDYGWLSIRNYLKVSLLQKIEAYFEEIEKTYVLHPIYMCN